MALHYFLRRCHGYLVVLKVPLTTFSQRSFHKSAELFKICLQFLSVRCIGASSHSEDFSSNLGITPVILTICGLRANNKRTV